jgi:UDP-glucuronate 4-epimerase
MTQRRPVPLFGDGTTARDYTWIDDIMAGVLAAIDRGADQPEEYQVINLGGSRTTDLKGLVTLLADALGVSPTVEWLPPQAGDVVRTWADVTKAHRLLGYDPQTPIEEGIPRFVGWFRETGSRERGAGQSSPHLLH